MAAKDWRSYRAPSRPWRRRPVSRRRSRLAVAGIGVGLLGAFGLLWGWRVSAVEVSGSSIIPNAAVRDAVLAELQGRQGAVFPRSSVLLLRTSTLERAIRDRFAFASVSAQRRLNGRLDVAVTEQPIAAVVSFSDGPAMLLAVSGEIIALAPESLNNAVSLLNVRWGGRSPVPGGRFMPEGALIVLRDLWTELGQTGGALQPQYIGGRASSTSAFDIHTVGGMVVTAVATGDGAERQLSKLRAVLRQYSTPDARARLRILDLRYGDRVYVQ